MMHRPALVLIGFSLLSACSGKGDFPSLAKRPIESGAANTIPAASPAPITAIDAAALNRIGSAVAKAEASQAAFDAALGQAQSAVTLADGAAFASESWVAAQMALSVLERTRAQAKSAIADIDAETRIIFERQPNADRAPLMMAASKIAAIDGRQSEIMAALLARLRSR